MSPEDGQTGGAFVRPRWVYRILWTLHRAGYAITGGRLGLRAAADDHLGILRLTTTGRRSGKKRATMLFFVDQLADYRRYAESSGREIPIVILEPTEREAHA